MKSVAGALALFEARLIIRSPILWGAAVVMLAWRTFVTWRVEPVWHQETVQTATACMLVGAGALIATSLATQRDTRPAMAELLAALPSGKSTRTFAVIVSGLTVAGIVGVVAAGLHLLTLLIGSTPAGRFDGYEVAAGVATVALMAATGSAIGRWAPNMIVAPVLVVALVWAVFQFSRSWLMPIVPVASTVGDVLRPSALHLGYVLALIVVVAGFGQLRHGVRFVRASVTALAAVTAVLFAAVTAAQPEVRERETVAATASICRHLNDVEYCAYPAFASWIPLWQGVADPVAQAVPPEARSKLPKIVQRESEGTIPEAMIRTSVLMGMTWGRNGGEADLRRQVSEAVAAAAVGLPGTRYINYACDLQGQARGVVLLWLAGQAGDLPERSRSFAVLGLADVGYMDFGDAQAGYARRLLAMPGARERIWANWDRLVAPATTMTEGLKLLGMASDLPVEKAQRPECP